jgi:hypothetical protein
MPIQQSDDLQSGNWLRGVDRRSWLVRVVKSLADLLAVFDETDIQSHRHLVIMHPDLALRDTDCGASSAQAIWAIWPYLADQKPKVSTVEEQLVISPGSNLQNWNTFFQVTNRGPATAKHIACLFLANAQMHFATPQVVGNGDAGAAIATGVTSSTASISIKDLSPDTGASFDVPIQAPDSLAVDVFDTWKSKMFQPEFLRNWSLMLPAQAKTFEM